MDALKTGSSVRKRKVKKSDKKTLKVLLLKGPVMSESQFQSFQKIRENFEAWKGK